MEKSFLFSILLRSNFKKFKKMQKEFSKTKGIKFPDPKPKPGGGSGSSGGSGGKF